MRLVYVEDDQDFREAAAAELEDLGFEVDCFADGASLLDAFANGASADVIVLDWNLPMLSGIELIPRLRRAGVLLPVVLLTGRSTPNLENLALDHGALDFVDKTRGLPILAKRIRLILDSAKKPEVMRAEEVLDVGALQLKLRVCRASWNGADVGLTLTEYKIVHLLVSNLGNHLTYRAVYDTMHHEGFIAGSGEDGYRTNVRSCIKRIRNKFRALDGNFACIANYPSFGYRWEVDPLPPPSGK
ncbi:MAG: response regulator transcription factor [Proteobacteria bacterium]|nr:response regulator transcription factor [Pseudomonadota bacterium]